MQNLSDIIRNRRSVFPASYNGEAVAREEVEEMLENANWAPTHRFTEPWRFKVFHSSEARGKLGDFLSEHYKKVTPEAVFSEAKYKKQSFSPSRSGCVIAIVLHRDTEERVPEWEELAAVACAVQNMMLTAHDLGLGCYWSTPGAIKEMSDFLALANNEKCIGLLYIGQYDKATISVGKRKPIAEKVVWYE